MSTRRLRTIWRYTRPLFAPLLLCAALFLMLREPIAWWLHGEQKFDQTALTEWIHESNIDGSLPGKVRAFLNESKDLFRQVNDRPLHEISQLELLTKYGDPLRTRISQWKIKREEIEEHLKSLCIPPTKMYSGQLPLFPVIYRLSIDFDDRWKLQPILWDSELPRHSTQYRELPVELCPGAVARLQYRLHAYTQRQHRERQEVTRRLWLSALGIVVLMATLIWVYIVQHREREREQQRNLADQQVSEAERRRLQEALKREEAERQREEAERQTLELKSQLFANIGIMAGSYAHNIKNLLVRPNDLLSRCLEDAANNGEHTGRLREVRDTLGTVTERLQQILQTVRRDPSRSERVRIDLNQLVMEMYRTWNDLAHEKWKLELTWDLASKDGNGELLPLWIEGDLSHLQQALENLLFNARDATFQMRNHLRDQARRGKSSDAHQQNDGERRQAIIAAAGWMGNVTLHTHQENDFAVLEVRDNGIGMDDEVRTRCLETHFSTKRDNALFAGLSSGMGLGLSFVTVILEHHQARLEIESVPMCGSTFRVIMPVASGSLVKNATQSRARDEEGMTK